MTREFSIKKEIEFEVTENLNNLDVDIERIYDEVESDELMLDMITLSIYTAIENQLKEKGIQSEEVDYTISQLKRTIVSSLMDRGII